MPAGAAVEILRQPGHSFRGVAHHDLRRPELLTCTERIGEQFVGKSQLHADVVILILLDLPLEASGVHETHAVAVSVILRRHVINQKHGRTVLVAGCTSGRADGHRPVAHSLPLHAALHAVTAVEGDRVKVPCHKVQACALRFFQGKCASAAVFDPDSPGNNIELRKNTVIQIDFQPEKVILERDDQSLRIRSGILIRLIRINSRQARDAVQPLLQAPGIITQVAVQCPVLIRDLQLNAAVVPIAQIRILLRKEVHGIRAVRFGLIRIAGKTSVLESQQKMHVSLRPAAVVLVQQISVTVYMHLIGGPFRVQCENESLFININRHGIAPFYCQ